MSFVFYAFPLEAAGGYGGLALMAGVAIAGIVYFASPIFKMFSFIGSIIGDSFFPNQVYLEGFLLN